MREKTKRRGSHFLYTTLVIACFGAALFLSFSTYATARRSELPEGPEITIPPGGSGQQPPQKSELDAKGMRKRLLEKFESALCKTPDAQRCTQASGGYFWNEEMTRSDLKKKDPNFCQEFCKEEFNTDALKLQDKENDDCCCKIKTDKPLPPESCTDDTMKLQIPFTRANVDLPICTCLLDGSKKCDGLAAYIVELYKWLVAFAAIAGMLIFVYGGLLWMTARGDSGQVSEAKKVMLNALVGLILALGSYAILWVINPRLTQAPSIMLEAVKRMDIKYIGPSISVCVKDK